MTDRKPFAASTIRGPLPGESEPTYAGPTDELGYPLDEPALAIATGDDRFPQDVNLLVTALGCIGFTGTLVLDHGVVYGEQISRLDLSVDWTILQAATGRRLACIKYDLRPSEGTWAEWRARATKLGVALIFLKRCVAGRQEVWDRIRTGLESAGLGSPPAEPPGDEAAGRREQPADQPPEQRQQQGDALEGPTGNALETHPGSAATPSARPGHARDLRELDELITLAKPPQPPAARGPAGHDLRTSDDPAARSRAGRELARRRWGRRGHRPGGEGG